MQDHPLAPTSLDAHDHGLAHDMQTLLHQVQGRRKMLNQLLAGGLLSLPLVGCGGGGSETSAEDAGQAAAATSGTGTTTTTSTTGSSSCSTIPSETGGPYPGDGTNTVNGSTANALTQSGIVRANIVSSFGSSSGKAVGVPLTITLNVVNTSSNCASLAGFAVYLWHCDQLGRYSMYSSGVTGENYLRGVQVTDSSGSVTFTSIFPGCYAGRWPHIHFEVYSSQASAINGKNAIKTSQIALPATASSAVFATSNYTGSAANFAAISLASDNVFSDGATLQTPSITGSVSAGYAITLQVGVAV